MQRRGSNQPTISIHTHGCKLNQAESEAIALQLAEVGFEITDTSPADVFVLNTCTVTHVADRKARQWLRHTRRQNPESLIIVTGCYAQRANAELDKLGADVVCPNRDKAFLTQIITERLGKPDIIASSREPEPAKLRTRSFIKIQDGCQGPCTYCIVPQVRPDVFSEPPEQIVAEVRKRITLGYKEVVLTGTEIGNYRYRDCDIKSLVTRILTGTAVERLRLSSLQPEHVTPQLLTLWQDPRLGRHFHIALQSGCDEVLAAMARRYTTATYYRALELIREHVPDAAITTDLIVGFPGESDRQFDESCRFIRSCGFSAIHVFPYSPRPGTVAANLKPQVPARDKRERITKALRLTRLMAREFREMMVGSVHEVLWEAEAPMGSKIYSGFTSNYVRVFTRSEKNISNQILKARIIGYRAERLWAELT